MAQKVQTLFIDDIDGGAADGTVRFGLDGTDYEIDLSGEHNDELHKALERYIAHGRKVGGAARRSARNGGRRASSSTDTTAVRAWAREQGIDIKERGRVPADVVAKYQAATGS
jgi:nucleoid-associated protein Lsr2